MNILNEANSDLHEDVMDELKLLQLDVMNINDLFQIDFGDKPDEWIYSIGLDNDHADAIFLRQISTKAESASIKNKIFLLSEKLTDAFCQVTVERSGTARLFFSNT